MVSDAASSWPSLAAPALAPLWAAVRERLERTDAARRGRLKLPALSPQGRHLLAALVDAPVRTTLDLALLEAALCRLGVADDLPGALAALGFPLSPASALRRTERQEAARARAAARALGASWGEEAAAWVEALIRGGALAGLDAPAAVGVLRRAHAVLERIAADTDEGGRRLSRVDLAARVLGSAHGLDWGTREGAAVTRALEMRHAVRGRAAWEVAGVDWDLVSAPVPVWGLAPQGGLGALLADAAALGLPLHLSLLALRSQPVVVPADTIVLVAENPRLVEAAAQARLETPVVALNGNPAGAAQLLIAQLRESAADLRYHGDFDAAGLRICGRMHGLGLVPWKMGADDYRSALALAEAAGAELPRDPLPVPETPWAPELAAVFARCRRIVHEERLLPDLLVGL